MLAALALLFGLCLTVAGATVQWLYDPAHMVTRELPGDRVACSIFAAMASALAAIVVVGTVTIVAYIVSTLWRAFRT